MALLAILQPDVRAAARISTALGAAHDVVACASWRALRASMKKGQVDGCIVDARREVFGSYIGDIWELFRSYLVPIESYIFLWNPIESYRIL